MSSRPTPSALLPVLVGGVLMAAYLLLRPYGDAAGASSPEAAQAFASQLWVASHVCGMLALGAYALGVYRLTSPQSGRASLVARRAAVAGAFLVQPYYGAEAFGLHVVGLHAVSRPELLSLVAEIRDNGWAMALFVAGLLALMASGVALARSQRSVGRWTVWPLATLMVLFVPQYYLPPVGRMAFGVAYLAASLVLAREVVAAAQVDAAERAAAESFRVASPEPIAPSPRA